MALPTLHCHIVRIHFYGGSHAPAQNSTHKMSRIRSERTLQVCVSKYNIQVQFQSCSLPVKHETIIGQKSKGSHSLFHCYINKYSG